MPTPKIFVGSAIWRSVEVAHLTSLVPLLRQPNVEYGPQTGDALVERARGISATYFLKHSNADVHLSIDSDIVGFTVEDTLRLCELAETHDIVVASYVCRSAQRTFPASYYEAGVRVLHAFDHTPVPIKWGATGFMAVHRRVFEKMAEGMTLLHPSQPWAFYNFYQPFEYEDADTGEPILLSEDYAFCQRAKELGFSVYMDPAIRLGHMGTHIFRLEDTAQPLMEPQPLALTRNGKVWHVEGLVGAEASPLPSEPINIARGLRMYVDPQDVVISLNLVQHGLWEEPVAQAIERYARPDWSFMDLGANIGVFTLVGAKAFKDVIAVEPAHRAFGLLERNVQLNGFENVRLFNAAAGDTERTSRLVPTPGNPGNAYISDGEAGELVQVTLIRSFVNGHWPEVVKLDIEGMEYRALQACPELLEYAQVVVFEVAPDLQRDTSGVGDDELIRLVRDAGFTVTHLDGAPLGTYRMPQQEGEYINLLAVR